MVLRLETSMIDFSSIYLISPCFGNNFSQYRIWSPKDDSREIDWVNSCPFPTGPYCVIVLFSAVSDTSALVYSPTFPSLIVIAPPVLWVGAAVG